MLTHSEAVPGRPSRVVVVGSDGFVGRATIAKLRQQDIVVLAVNRKVIDLATDDAGDKLAALLRPDDSVVAAAARAPCKSIDMLIDNMAIARSLVRAVERVRVSHLVNISSDAVYGDEPVPLTEAAPEAPGSLHGVMHLAREIAFGGLPVPVAHVRPTLIYGPGDPHNGYGPNRFMRLASAGEPLVLFGEGEERRDHVHIDDVAEIVVRILRHRSRGAVNVASGEVTSFRDAATLAVAACGSASRVEGTPRQGPMPHNGYRPFDIAVLRKAFPDIVPVLLRDGIAKSIPFMNEARHAAS